VELKGALVLRKHGLSMIKSGQHELSRLFAGGVLGSGQMCRVAIRTGRLSVQQLADVDGRVLLQHVTLGTAQSRLHHPGRLLVCTASTVVENMILEFKIIFNKNVLFILNKITKM